MASVTHYTESQELRQLADQLAEKYYSVIGYVNLDKVFFAFKGGDLPAWFKYEILGAQNDWFKYSSNMQEPKLYCLAMTYDFYQKAQGSLLQWTVLDLLYTCGPKMNGKLRKKDVHEHFRIVHTLEDLGDSFDWRENTSLPELLGDEMVVFGAEEEESEDIAWG